MNSEALKLILKSNDWNQFVNYLSEFGNAPQYKALKGEAFEYLTKFSLKIDPVFSLKFKNVFHHSELPITTRVELKLPHPEVGVDLIAECYDGLYYAIQCKFHQEPSDNVTYHELSTFFSVTERYETFANLSHRLICTSAYEVSKTVKKLHPDKLGYLTYHDFAALNRDSFEKIHSLIKGQKPVFRPLTPRRHQINAISKVSKHFNDQLQSRGKIIHPCGAGKSLTAYWVAKNLSSQNILIAVPSLALVRQTLNSWSHQALADKQNFDYLAVCSDKDVGQVDDPLMNSHDLGISVTTSVPEVIKFLQSENTKIKILITTYQSGEVVISSAKELQFKFDLGIFDEAHKTSGDRTKKFALLLDDKKIKFHKKIFMTATERQFLGDSTNLLSMDNEETYGAVIDQLSFSNALKENPPILCKYKIITLSVTRKEIEKLVIENSLTKANGDTFTFTEDSATLAALIAHRKLSDDRGLKHAISFHKSIKRAREFKELNDLINSNNTFEKKVHSFHVSGKMGTSIRNIEIERFQNNVPSIISNARCLTEGVDIPAVDAVVFADPKQSLIDIVQAAGRAMRTHFSKSIGYIVIPVVIDNQNEEKINDAFKQIVQVIAALGIADERIIDEAKLAVKTNSLNSGNILEFVEHIPTEELEFETFFRELQIKIWDRVSFARSVVGESKFNKWMQNNTDLSEASREKYTRVVRKISNDLVKLNLAYSSLEEITEKADLEKLKEEYFSIDEYRDLDKRGNRMYSSGFNMLVKFQKSRSAQNHPSKISK